jgi:type I restriction enzyme S subunit
MSETRENPLPPGWAVAPIEDLFWPLEDGRTLHQGWSPQCKKTPAQTNEDWGVLKTTAIQAGEFLPQHNKQLPEHLEPRPQSEVKTGDILITCAGPRVRCGVACLVRNTRPRLMMSGKMYRFRVSPDKFDARYLEAFLLTPAAQAAIDKMKTGGSDSGLNLTHDRFRPLPVPVAPLKEQQRMMDLVEELMSDLDAGVSALKRVQTKLEAYRASVLKAAVEGALTAEWREKHPAKEPASALLTRILNERRRRWEEAQLQKFKNADKEPPKNWKDKYKEPAPPKTDGLPQLPAGWIWVSLDQIFEVERGRFSIRPRNDPRYYGGQEPFVQIGDLPREGGSIKAYHQTLNDAGLSVSKKFPAGTVLIAIVGATIGNTGILAFDSCCPDSLVALQCSSSNRLRFAEFFLRKVKLTLRLAASASGGQPNINLNLLQPMAIPLPPENELEAIIEVVEDQISVIDHLETDLESQLKSAQALRQSIFRSAFKGQLVPQNPKDEPAAELLKRIAAEREEIIRQAKAAKKPIPKKRFKLPSANLKNEIQNRQSHDGRIFNR